jgi:sucrose phosphorylase
MSITEKLNQRFERIYKGQFTEELVKELVDAIDSTREKTDILYEKWTEKDIILITYGDSILNRDEKPLQVLNEFLKQYIGDSISYVHILPFFPYSSDDGFSVIDYRKVNPELGDWSDVSELKKHYKLMFDLVINHISQHSDWYQNYLKGADPGKDYFIEADPDLDLSMVVRPRSLPLVTPAETSRGKKYVWTTFSDDQIDLNFASPRLMVEMIKIFLYYLEQGATMIRLDAIAFLWKEFGTNCLHLQETHEFVKVLRDITDYINPGLILLTETNVPNQENLSYFGDNDEANMVYQFSLPPLLLHALYSGNSGYLTNWASTVPTLNNECSFFNFTASHDGVGVRPLEGLIPRDELDKLVNGMRSFGGFVNTRRNTDGSDSPYELNIAYFDAMKGTITGEDEYQEARFICSQTIMMTLSGVPAFYIHSLLATQNYHEGVKQTGMNRTINRRKWTIDELYPLLTEDSHHKRVLFELLRRIAIRKQQVAFHPNNSQEIIDLGSRFFCVARADRKIVAVFNITPKEESVNIQPYLKNVNNIDIISGMTYNSDFGKLMLAPYQAIWLVAE